jgi:hypothetical protein
VSVEGLEDFLFLEREDFFFLERRETAVAKRIRGAHQRDR